MPPFRLEPLPYQPPGKIPKTLYCLKSYNDIVKVTDWEKHSESQPIDTDPYCKEGLNLHLSHYDRLGSEKNDQWTTETQDMLREGATVSKDLGPVHRPMFNFFTFHRSECKDYGYICPRVCADNYITTMQYSYEPPYPYPMQRLPISKTAILECRKLKERKECKYLDDTFVPYTKLLQQTKHHDHVSYNPFTNLYTDGTEEYRRQRKCYDIKKNI